ncbi:ATP-binding protein [Cytophagaceae bacterium ABcell3]|nr:ATP-binding protein [Cytophagaceae bacterium ABcell3]
MSVNKNPFFLTGYHGPNFFCDRKQETERLTSNLLNGVNSTLLSIRRMGKTGLIHHCFHLLNKNSKVKPVYIDIYSTQNFKEFTNTVAAAVVQAFPESNPIGKKLMKLIKSFRPIISFDPLTGLPEINLEFSRSGDYEQSLTGILSFLEQQKIEVLIAFDEFQQIATYPERNIEAFLRTLIQPLKNVHFIFSGSNKHLLSEMFNDSKRPFFSSTQAVYLEPIPHQEYFAYILEKFKQNKRKIDDDSINFILDFSKLHTYYTQVICNRLFACGESKINLETTKLKCSEILKEQEYIFYQYRSLLTNIQWNLLKAIAKTDKVYHPTSSDFLKIFKVGTATNVQRALEALLNKEMIYKDMDGQGQYYRVYDCFLSRWLEQQN